MTKSRTIWVNTFIAILGFIELNLHLVQENLSEYYGIVFLVIGAVNIGLRMITTQPLSERKLKNENNAT